MQRQPLPKLVDARKLASAESEISASVPVSELPRLAEGLAATSGLVDVDLRFFRDEQRFFRIAGKAVAGVQLLCQRCLEAMPVDIHADFELAIVWNDDQAKALPRNLDPLLLGEDPLSLYELVQDELILNTPFVSYHDAAVCKVDMAAVNAANADTGATEKKETGNSPFSVLGQLRSLDE